MGSTRIKPLVAIAATLGAGALVLSACGGGSSDGASGSSAAPESSAASSSAASESPAAEGACAPEDIFLVQSGRGLEKGRLGIGALANGIVRAALETAVEHAKSRQQFGVAIADFQAIAFMLADMQVDYDAGRLLLERAAVALEQRGHANSECSIAKLFTSESAVRNTSRAVQILGGAGFIRGVEAERLYRDARITTLYEGTSEIQRTVISREILG